MYVDRRKFLKYIAALSVGLRKSLHASNMIAKEEVIDIKKYLSVAVPRGHGQIISLDKYYRARYPSRDQSMQFMLFINEKEGLYVQTTNQTGSIIDWEIFPKERLLIRIYGNTCSIIKKKISSDFREAAAIYREWALNQYWAIKKPSVIDDVSIIAMEVRPGDSLDSKSIFKFVKNFKKPTGCWITQWRKYNFDTQYPNYEPANREIFTKFLAGLNSMGTYAIPYVNALLWDKNCVYPKIDNNLLVVDSKNSYVSYNREMPYLKYACPSMGEWKSIILGARNSIKDTSNKLSAGVYYDMLAAAEPIICFAKNHNHSVGDPFSWIEGIRRILAETNGIILTEGNAEIYIDLSDAFLMHLYTDKENIIPLWNEVYGSIVRSVGWYIQDDKKNEIDPNKMLNRIQKAKYFGAHCYGSPYMFGEIQDQILKKEYSIVMKLISS